MRIAGRFFEISPELLVITNPDGFFINVNQAWEKSLGWTIAEMQASPFLDFIHPDDRDSTIAEFQALLAGSNTIDFENRYRHKNGSFRTLSWRASLDLESGNILGIARDISDSKKSHLLLEQTQKALGIGTWEIDLETKSLYWSEETHKIHGTDPRTYQPLLEDGLSFYHPDSQPILIESVQKLMSDGTPFALTLKFITLQKQAIWVESHGAAEIKNNKPIRVYGTFQNVTERVNHQIQLTNERNQFQSLVDSLNQSAIVSITDHRGRISYANEMFCQISGYSQEELVGNSHSIINSGHHSRDFFKEMWHCLLKGQRWHGEICNKDKSGKIYWVDSTIMPFQSATEKAKHFIAIRFDITPRKNLEAELIQASQREAAANSAKSIFLATMSHEIRSPLNGVIGMSQVLEKTKLTEEQKDCVSTIQSSAHHLLSLISDILDFSKIEAGKMELEMIPFDLNHLLLDLSRSFRMALHHRPIQIALESPLIENKLLGDPGRIRQILQNFLSNASKFMDKGTIQLRAKLIQEPKPLLRLEVQDQGIGIAPEVCQNLFRPFVQADSSTTRRYGGSGLGLSISKRLIELMSGQIGVDSELGKGSCFWIEIPMVISQSLIEESQVEKREDSIFAFNDRVLVVDDNSINLKVARMTLEKLGLQVITALSAEEAFRFLEHETFHLIFMDCQMPEIDGYEATRRIRASPRPEIASLPIVAMTANALQGDREACLKAGMNEYLSKPIAQDALLQILRQFLSKKTPQLQSPLTLDSDPKAQPQCFDAVKLLSLFQGQETALSEIIQQVIDVHSHDLAIIRSRLDQGDMLYASKHIHRLKGVIANFFADRLGRGLQGLESACQQQSQTLAFQRLGEVEEEMQRFLQELKQLKISLAPRAA